MYTSLALWKGLSVKIEMTKSAAESIRDHATDSYIAPARHRRERTFSINAGEVHKALGLNNCVPSVCSALSSNKFLAENNLRLISKTGPPSGRSTTVTYTYEFVDTVGPSSEKPDAWTQLRGALKDVFADLGGGEAYLQSERKDFRSARDHK
jgi:hypothetical protein